MTPEPESVPEQPIIASKRVDPLPAATQLAYRPCPKRTGRSPQGPEHRSDGTPRQFVSKNVPVVNDIADGIQNRARIKHRGLSYGARTAGTATGADAGAGASGTDDIGAATGAAACPAFWPHRAWSETAVSRQAPRSG